MSYVNTISVGGFRTGHVQGIAIDSKKEYMYYSFTTCLVKSDMKGNVIGTVNGLAGHLGCIAYNPDDGCIYGSLEYKHDCIGTGILNRLHQKTDVIDGFYIAIFDVEKINRLDMDAEKDQVMTSVYLKEVADDYLAPGHRYGCSGIDGVTFAPIPGSKSPEKYLYVAYGIYGDVNRKDNDYQIILRYDIGNWHLYEKPLDQSAMHKQGPSSPDAKYFIYTGNTTFGIQNLEYDPHTNYMFAAVYLGEKKTFPNYPLFAIDMTKIARQQDLKGIGHYGQVLTLAEAGETDVHTGIRGFTFAYGATGMISLGDSWFYFSHDKYSKEEGWSTTIKLYQYTQETFAVTVQPSLQEKLIP